ncbi:MAG TPA: HAD-IA family hydrolase [Urbifossiella sp.]|nr:HAD-IA family hydrolase [Urbifossiella sp.]
MSLWVHPGIRAVAFDAVGTLLFPNPSATEIYRALAERQGVTLAGDDVRRRFVEAYRIEEEADRANRWITSEQRERQRWYTIVTTTLHQLPDPEAAFEELFEHFALPSAWQLHEEAAAAFAALQSRGIVLALGTNYDARINRVVVGMPGLEPLAERVVVSAAVGFRKPAAEFFQEVVRVLGCRSDEVLFVGDDLQNDYDGAQAAGLESVLFDPAIRSNLPRRIARLSELTA